MTNAESTYFRKGLGLKKEVADTLSADYHSRLVDVVRDNGYALTAGNMTFRLAKEFGFCYGVDRAVDYAYQSRVKFPGKRIFLVGEIIHNPHVNEKLERMDVNILHPTENGHFDFSSIRPDDVVIIPAFGVTVTDLATLKGIGCVLIDTTCGSVLNVWKRVEQYARDGFTALIHGKYYHEESKATASQVSNSENGRYIIVRDMSEAEIVCDFIENDGAAAGLEERFVSAISPGFSADRDLLRIGVANQTTMLAKESLAIADRIGQAMIKRYGAANLADHFRSFDTICSATQERQDAVIDLINEQPDIMMVIGGYNSSNTSNLATICSENTTTYHIADAVCIDPAKQSIRHKPVGAEQEVEVADWLAGVETIGVTAGASTPNNKIGEALERILESRGIDVKSILTAPVS